MVTHPRKLTIVYLSQAVGYKNTFKKIHTFMEMTKEANNKKFLPLNVGSVFIHFYMLLTILTFIYDMIIKVG